MPDVEVGGDRLHYEDAGAGEPVVLVHGAASSGRCFDAHVPVLSTTHRVIVPDLRSMGRNARTDAIPPAAWTGDLVALLDHLGIERAHLCGTSLGARIVLRLGVLVPERVASIAADAPIVTDSPGGSAALERAFGAEMPATLATEMEHWNGDDWRAVVANYLRIRSDPRLQRHLDLSAHLERVTCPVLVTRGDADDPIHSLADAVQVHARVRDSRLWICPETAFSAARFAPGAFLERYLAFLTASGA